MQLIQLHERLDRSERGYVQRLQLLQRRMLLRFEERHLEFPPSGGNRRLLADQVPGGASAILLEAPKHFLRPHDNLRRDASHSRYLNAIAAIGATRHQLVQPDDVVALLFNCHAEVLDAREVPRQLVQVVIMSSEKGLAADSREMLGDRPGDGEAVVGARASPNLVQYDEAPLRRVVQYVGGFVHLNHKSGLTRRELIVSADP